MKRQEEIIREKLEAYEEVLPEGSLEEFRSRYDASKAAAARKTKRNIWYCGALALAACVAVVIVLTMPQYETNAPEESQVVEFVRNDETVESDEPVGPVAGAQVVKGVAVVTSGAIPKVADPAKGPDLVIDGQTRREEDGNDVAPEEKKEVSRDDGNSSVLVSNNAYTHRSAGINIVPVAVTGGVVIGGTLLGGVLASVRYSGGMLDVNPEFVSSGSDLNPEKQKDVIVGAGKHSLPLKIGTGIRWMMTERLSLTSALEYSLYTSEFNRSLSGKHKQQAHYLGIPLRLDYSFVRSRWLDVYAGGGGTADYCLSAKDNGVFIRKDGFTFSLQAVAGAQLNFTGKFGVFIEPQVSWVMPSENRVLETYRTEHPVSINIAAGIRMTFGK